VDEDHCATDQTAAHAPAQRELKKLRIGYGSTENSAVRLYDIAESPQKTGSENFCARFN